MEYYNELMTKARAYLKLARFYKNANHPSWKTFVQRGMEVAKEAREIKANV